MDKTIIDLPEPYIDDRGIVQVLVDFPVASVLVIDSKAGSVRGNHYHKKGAQYCYLASGCVEYHHRPVGSSESPQVLTVEMGQLFYTPPLVEHAVRFLADSVLYVFSTLNRDQEGYESDVVRVKLI